MTPVSKSALFASNRPAAPASDWRALWLIGRRAAVEALHDRMTVIVSCLFAFVFPLLLVLGVIRQVVVANSGNSLTVGLLSGYVLLVGLIPTTSAVGVAAGQFAGEHERGNLAPLLASPASNFAIFGGKVLGAVLPALLFAALAECTYLVALLLATGAATVRLIPLALGVAMLALVPGVALFAATASSLISSRVRTFNAAQQITSLLLLPLWGVLFGVGFKLAAWGGWTIAVAIAFIYALDLVLIATSAATWRREEVLARL